MRIGEAAARAGTSRDTLRYYEREGLIPKAPRTSGGYRDYSEALVDRVRMVRNALRFGFSIKQVTAFLRARDDGKPPCLQVRAAAAQLRTAMDKQIEDLTAARAAIDRALADWDDRLAKTATGRPARLLEALPEHPAARPARVQR